MATARRAATSTSTKRILQELAELTREPSPLFTVVPLEDDLFELHFTIRGPADSPFESGLYHGRLLLPSEYPYKPPEIVLLTPNGRFETGKRICLSITQHHVETWQPCWGIRTMLTALIGFMPTKGDGAVGALDFRDEDRRELAAASRAWRCARCGIDHATGDVLSNAAAAPGGTEETEPTPTPPMEGTGAGRDTSGRESVVSEEARSPSLSRPAPSTDATAFPSMVSGSSQRLHTMERWLNAAVLVLVVGVLTSLVRSVLDVSTL